MLWAVKQSMAGGERYLTNKSCLIWMSKGLKHCPIRIVRMDALLWFPIGNVGKIDPYKPSSSDGRLF